MISDGRDGARDRDGCESATVEGVIADAGDTFGDC